MHKSTYDKMTWFRDKFLEVSNHLKILDIGSLDNSNKDYNYRLIFNQSNWEYVGLDFEDGKNVDILVDDIYNLIEIDNNSYDVVISGQLFEHLEFFWLTMGEIDRILKPGGYCCIIAPSAGPKHGSSNKDCYRFHEDGMRALANYVNFSILHVSTNHNAEPWCDTCLVARKSSSSQSEFNDLELRISNLENKLDSILISK